MTATDTVYVDLPDLKDYLAISTDNYDTQLTRAIAAASRSVDAYCHRKFWLDPTPVEKVFIPNNLLEVDFASNDPLGGDLGTTANLVITTDPSGTGTGTITWAAADYQLLPANAASAWPEARPWTALRAVGTKTEPWLVNTWLTHLTRVHVTGQWGWPTVPDAVIQATFIKAAKFFQRRSSAEGIAGFGEQGSVRLSRTADFDVCDLLDPYVAYRALVA